MSGKNLENKSLYLYTALIFLVAILMIIIAFFGQNNLNKNQPIQPESTVSSSITEKAAILSDENRTLLEQNRALQDENEKLVEENNAYSAEAEALRKEIENQNKLLNVYDKLYKNKKSEAKELLLEIYTDDLTDVQKEFFDILVKKSQ